MPPKLVKISKDLDYLNLRILLRDIKLTHLIRKIIFTDINFVLKLKLFLEKYLTNTSSTKKN